MWSRRYRTASFEYGGLRRTLVGSIGIAGLLAGWGTRASFRAAEQHAPAQDRSLGTQYDTLAQPARGSHLVNRKRAVGDPGGRGVRNNRGARAGDGSSGAEDQRFQFVP